MKNGDCTGCVGGGRDDGDCDGEVGGGCSHLEPAATAATVGAEIDEIRKLIGPAPLDPTPKQMYYLVNKDGPSPCSALVSIAASL